MAPAERSDRTGPSPSQFATPTAPGTATAPKHPASNPGRARVAAAQHLPDPRRRIGAGPALAHRRLGEVEQERVHGRLHALVLVDAIRLLVRRRERIRACGQRPSTRSTSATPRRSIVGGQVPVEVVAVDGVHVVAQPDAGIGEPHRGRPSVCGERLELRCPPGSPSCSSPSAGSPASVRRSSQASIRWWSWLPGTITSSRPAIASPSAATAGPAASSTSPSGRSRSSSTSPSRTRRSTCSSAATSGSRNRARRNRSAPLPGRGAGRRSPRCARRHRSDRRGRDHHRSDGAGSARPRATAAASQPAARHRRPWRRADGGGDRDRRRGRAHHRGGDRARAQSPAVERAIIRVLGRAAQDALQRTLSSPAVERAASGARLQARRPRHQDAHLPSDEAQKLIERIAEAPELEPRSPRRASGCCAASAARSARSPPRQQSRALRPAGDRPAPHSRPTTSD